MRKMPTTAAPRPLGQPAAPRPLGQPAAPRPLGQPAAPLGSTVPLGAAALLAVTLLLAAALWLEAPPANAQQVPPGYVQDPPVEPGLAPGMVVEESAAVVHAYSVRFTSGDEILSGLTDLARREGIAAAQITGLGGLAGALLAFGDPAIGERMFKLLPIVQKSELVSLDGTVSLRDGEPSVHLHAVLAFSDGTTRGGHVLELEVAPVAEVTILATEMMD